MFALIDKGRGYLFSSRKLEDVIAHVRASMHSEVEQLDADRLLNTAPADLVRYFGEKYDVEVPLLRRDDWYAVESETRVDVSKDPNRFFRDEGKAPFFVAGQRIAVHVPFEGEPELLYARPSRFTTSPPRAQVDELQRELVFVYEMPHDAVRDIRPELDRTLAAIEDHLGWIRNEIDNLKRGLPAEANQAIEERRRRILANQDRVAGLGIPIRQRKEAPATYVLPTVRRKVMPPPPPASTAPLVPEPVLDSETYEHILKVIQNMAHVMERSPSAFSQMGEEDLRQHFLVQLNGQFEGNATGETFNAGGKTDILLREKDRNVFIAECKFWKGPKQFAATIDQLLGYTAWRDTKAAILVFNRGFGTSTVINGVKETAQKHSNFKRSVDWPHESGARYVFHQRGDVNRELLLTVLVFDVPSS